MIELHYQIYSDDNEGHGDGGDDHDDDCDVILVMLMLMLIIMITVLLLMMIMMTLCIPPVSASASRLLYKISKFNVLGSCWTMKNLHLKSQVLNKRQIRLKRFHT